MESIDLIQYDEESGEYIVFYPFSEDPSFKTVSRIGEKIAYNDVSGKGYIVEVRDVIHGIDGSADVVVGKQRRYSTYKNVID
jgi:hypothetical protein